MEVVLLVLTLMAAALIHIFPKQGDPSREAFGSVSDRAQHAAELNKLKKILAQKQLEIELRDAERNRLDDS